MYNLNLRNSSNDFREFQYIGCSEARNRSIQDSFLDNVVLTKKIPARYSYLSKGVTGIILYWLVI